MKSFITNKGKISYTYKDSGLYGEFINNCRLEAWKYVIKKHNLSLERILDVGCSYGSWCENWKELGFKILVGADVNEYVLDKARTCFDSVYHVEDVPLDVALDGKLYRSVASNAVLIHILEDSEVITFLSEISKVLDPSGYFVCSVVTAEFYSYGVEITREDNCTRTLEHNRRLITESGLHIVDEIGTFINPWALDALKYIQSDEFLRDSPKMYKIFSDFSHILRGKSLVPFSEVLLVCKHSQI